MSDETSYPGVRFISRFGNLLAMIMGIAAAAGGIVAAGFGMGWWWGAAGVIGGPLVFLFVRVFSELVHIVSDTLLPQ